MTARSLLASTPLANIPSFLSYIEMASHAPQSEDLAPIGAPYCSLAETAPVVGQAAATTIDSDAALQQRPWRRSPGLSTSTARIERFLANQGFERAPWLAVGFAFGIAAWFVLPSWRAWTGLAVLLSAIACAAAMLLRPHGRFPHLREAVPAMALMALAGLLVVWAKSELVGVPPIARPMVAQIAALVLDRQPQPAEQRVRLVVATRDPGDGRTIRVRLNLPLANDRPGLERGARIMLRARLVPPAPPMLPGGFDFAQTAWFAGLAATGSVLGDVTIIAPARSGGWLRAAQAGLSRHIRERLAGPAGAIAAALASGDQGAIGSAEQDAMRNAGLSHLLSVSGLHLSAVVGAAYVLAMRLLALWPWLALRVRLPVAAASVGALAGIGYTLLTGSEVPTVRSCIGALLVLVAVMLGREALSLRMLAVAAFLVLLFWPEALVGPSFQLSFAAVIAIIALHASAPMRRYLAPREEGPIVRTLRAAGGLLVTGVVIELALMPIGLYHFHRAGVYGALANVVAIPLTTFVVMPLIAVALALDLVGLGAPAWWLTGVALDAMLAMAKWISAQPGAVTAMPAMGRWSFAMFVAGGLWLALWRGAVRLFGLVPVTIGVGSLALLRPPDILVSGDGRHVGIVGETASALLVLRASRSGYTTDTLSELAGMDGQSRLIADWPKARCTPDFCAVTLHRGGRDWRLLMARGRDLVPADDLAKACARSEIVIADRRLPPFCRPMLLKADAAMLTHTGGLAIDLERSDVTTVAQTQGDHGWWRAPNRRPTAHRSLDGGNTKNKLR